MQPLSTADAAHSCNQANKVVAKEGSNKSFGSRRYSIMAFPLDTLLVDSALLQLLAEVLAKNCALYLATNTSEVTDESLHGCAAQHFTILANVCARWKTVLNANRGWVVAAALWLLSLLDRTTRYAFKSQPLDSYGDHHAPEYRSPFDSRYYGNVWMLFADPLGERPVQRFGEDWVCQVGWGYRVDRKRLRIYKHEVNLPRRIESLQPRSIFFKAEQELVVNDLAIAGVPWGVQNGDLGFYPNSLTAGRGANASYFYVADYTADNLTVASSHILLIRKLRLDNGAPADDQYSPRSLPFATRPQWSWDCRLQSSGDGTRLLCNLRIRRDMEFYTYPSDKSNGVVRYWWLLDTRDGSIVYSYRACPQLPDCDSDLKDDLHFALSRDSLLVYRIYNGRIKNNNICFRLKIVPLRDIHPQVSQQRFCLSKKGFKSVADTVISAGGTVGYEHMFKKWPINHMEDTATAAKDDLVWTHCDCEPKPIHYPNPPQYPHYNPFFRLDTPNQNNDLFLALTHHNRLLVVDVANKRARYIARSCSFTLPPPSYVTAAFEFGDYTLYRVVDENGSGTSKYNLIPKISRIPMWSWN